MLRSCLIASCLVLSLCACSGSQNGCADGSRDAFTDANKWPDLAGCQGAWSQPFAQQSSGDQTPAGLCSDGWHLCSPDEAKARASSGDCSAQPGVFTALGLNVQGQNIDCPQGPCHGIYDYHCGDALVGPNDTSLHYAACGTDAVACTTYASLQVCNPGMSCGPDDAFSWNGANTNAGAAGHPRGVLCCR